MQGLKAGKKILLGGAISRLKAIGIYVEAKSLYYNNIYGETAFLCLVGFHF